MLNFLKKSIIKSDIRFYMHFKSSKLSSLWKFILENPQDQHHGRVRTHVSSKIRLVLGCFLGGSGQI